MYGMWKTLGLCCADSKFRDEARAHASTHAQLHNFLHEYGSSGGKAFKRISLWEAGDLRRILTDARSDEYLDGQLAEKFTFPNITTEEDWLAIIGLSLIDSGFRTELGPLFGETEQAYQERVAGVLKKYGFALDREANFVELMRIHGNPGCVAAMYSFNVYFWIYPECEPKVTANKESAVVEPSSTASAQPEDDEYMHVSCKWEQKLREAARANNVKLDQTPQPGTSVQISVPNTVAVTNTVSVQKIQGSSKGNGKADNGEPRLTPSNMHSDIVIALHHHDMLIQSAMSNAEKLRKLLGDNKGLGGQSDT